MTGNHILNTYLKDLVATHTHTHTSNLCFLGSSLLASVLTAGLQLGPRPGDHHRPLAAVGLTEQGVTKLLYNYIYRSQSDTKANGMWSG